MGKKELMIRFTDLKEKPLKKVLKFFNIKALEESNLDIIPLHILVKEDTEEANLSYFKNFYLK